ncbi:MAG: tetratricopeptide repeat protein [Chitinivibrionales bacterium]
MLDHKKLIIILIITISTAFPTFSGPVTDSANSAYSKGDTKRSITLFQKAADLGENPALCYFNIANGYFKLDSLPQALLYYQLCIGYAPTFFRAHLNLATVLYNLNDIGSAIASAKRALIYKPNNLKAMNLLSAAYKKAEAYPEAIAIMETIFQLYPENGDICISIAEIYRKLEDDTEALNWLKEYPEGGSNQDYVNILLADIYEKKGEHTQAIYYLKKSWEINNSNKWVYYRIVSLQKKSGNPLVALQTASAGLEKMPDFKELALLAGNLAFEAENYDTAERFYSKARELGSAGAVVGLENIRSIRLNN